MLSHPPLLCLAVGVEAAVVEAVVVAAEAAAPLLAAVAAP